MPNGTSSHPKTEHSFYSSLYTQSPPLSILKSTPLTTLSASPATPRPYRVCVTEPSPVIRCPSSAVRVIKTVLDYVLRETGDRIDHLVFVGTDQEDERYRCSDTLHYAQLAATVLAPRYGDKIGRASSERVGSDPPIDPSMYDEAFSAFQNLLHAHATSDVTACYLLPTGGLPACNTAMLIQGAYVFGKRCRVVYPSASGEPARLQLGGQVVQVMQENTAIELLQRFEFDAAYSMVVDSDRIDRATLALLQYASSRLRFDFVAAHHHLENAVSLSAGQARKKLQAIRDDLEKLLQADEPARIGELYYNARIAWDNGRFVGFLGRLVRFQTAVLRYLVSRLFKTSSQELQHTFDALAVQPDLRRFVLDTLQVYAESMPSPLDLSQDTDLLQQLRQNIENSFDLGELRALCFDLGIEYENLAGSTRQEKATELIDYSRRRGRLAELIDTCRERRPNAPWWDESTPRQTWRQNLDAICAALQRIDRLVPLRNESIIAHGYRGVSEEIILQDYNPEDGDARFNPIEDMAAICSALDISMVNPLRDIRDFVIQELR